MRLHREVVLLSPKLYVDVALSVHHRRPDDNGANQLIGSPIKERDKSVDLLILEGAELLEERSSFLHDPDMTCFEGNGRHKFTRGGSPARGPIQHDLDPSLPVLRSGEDDRVAEVGTYAVLHCVLEDRDVCDS